MRDYYNVLPDDVYLLKKHFTPGREGHRPEFITRHHLMYIGNGRDVVDQIWISRPASAHYVVAPKGSVCQTVWDQNTAWGNANWWANLRALVIEHSNDSGRVNGNDFDARSWTISDETIISGARLAAAAMRFYGMGAPAYGKNVNDHFQWTSTGCPVHLQGPVKGNAWGGRAGKYHFSWMEEAEDFYRRLQSRLVDPQGNPIKHNFPAPTPQPKKEEEPFMALSHDEQVELLAKTRELYNALLAPVPSTVPGSDYKAPRTTYLDHMDRKIEDLHVALKAAPSPTQQACDALQAASDAHDPADEHPEDNHAH